MTTEDKCTLCNQTREWHRTHKPKHEFTTEGDLREAEYGDDVPTKKTGPPFDPALRMLLIQKGIITADEIAEANKRLLAIQGTTEVVVAEAPQGEPTEAEAWK